MNLWFSLLALAVLQGVAEFLPISSSGHLALVKRWLDIPGDGNGLEMMLHFGTLLAVLAFYRHRLVRLLAGIARLESSAWRQGVALVAGCLPAVAAYVLFDDAVDRCLGKGAAFTGAMLLVTGAVLISTCWAREGRANEVGVGRALLIGLAQAAALLPGISRSGATISAARHLGVERREAADFSFLMSAVLLSGKLALSVVKGDLGAGLDGVGAGPAAVAAGVSAIVGYVSLRWLIRVLSGRHFWCFGLYCLLAGMVLVLLG